MVPESPRLGCKSWALGADSNDMAEREAASGADRGQHQVETLRYRVVCPDCGTVRVSGGSVTRRVCEDDGSVSFRFRCPSCGRIHVRHATVEVSRLLHDSGAPVECWRRPVERQPVGLEPITRDDLLAAHLLLDDDALVSAVVAVLG